MLAYKIFSDLSDQGIKALDIVRKESFSPQTKKTLKTWGISEVSGLVGRSSNYIRQQENEKKIPAPITKANKRVYTLEEIENLRKYFKTNKNSKNKCCTISFANFKGGAAKTTSAVNAAQFFALQGYRVLLIDCDSQASTTNIFLLEPK